MTIQERANLPFADFAEITPEDLDWSRTNPCDDCPFRKSSPYHEGIARFVEDKMWAIQNQGFAHTCHKTDNCPSCDGPRNYPGRPQHCAGAVLMLLKTGRGMDLQIPLLQAAERGDLDLDALTAKAKRSPDIFTLWEFMRFYEEKLKAGEPDEPSIGGTE